MAQQPSELRSGSPLIEFASERNRAWLFPVVLAVLVALLILAWGIFFNWGNFSINFEDWAVVWATRLEAWRLALQDNTLPFHLSDIGAMRSSGDRYFTVGDMVFTPQVILLKWMSVQMYTLVNQILLALVGTWFLVRFRNKYRLSVAAFTFMFLLFHFNGFIVTHMSEGHLSWGGYYLFPAFIFYLTEIRDGKVGWKTAGAIAWIMMFMMGQGSLHHYVWCLLALGFLTIIDWKHAPGYIKAIGFSVLLGIFRLIPSFYFEFGRITTGLELLGGYPSVGEFVKSLLYNVGPKLAMPGQLFRESELGYWEFSLFIGKIAFVAIGLLIVVQLLVALRDRSIPYLLLTAAFLTVLSIDDMFFKVFFYQPMIVGTERVISRFAGLALVIVIMISSIQLQRIFDRLVGARIWLVSLLSPVVLGGIGFELWRHMQQWSVVQAAKDFPYLWRDLSRIKITNHSDPIYFQVLAVSAGISLAAAIVLFILQRRSGGSATALQSGSDPAPAQPQ